MAQRRLHVVVMPEAFPTGPGDVGGVFSVDYVAAVASRCDVTVLMPAQLNRPGFSRVVRDRVQYVTYTSRLRDFGPRASRAARLESLYRLSRGASQLGSVDLIHAHGPIFHGLAATRIARTLDVPVVLTVHTNPFSKLLARPHTRLLTTRTLERVDCVCPVSDDLRRQIQAAGIRPRRVVVTGNPVDTELFRPAGEATLHKHIVFASRLEPYKGGLRVLRAFAQIADRWPGWRLTIAGDGPERPAIEAFLRARSDLEARVALTGAFTKAELAKLLAGADCFVFPSERETFGIVLAEAMAAGLPVLGPDRTAPPEFVGDHAGVLVPPDDVDAIADGLESLLSGLSTYDAAAIRSAVVERFGLPAFGERLHDLYSEVVGRREDAPCAA